jgi:hypothetical protein
LGAPAKQGQCCNGPEPALFDFTCATTDLVSIAATGACVDTWKNNSGNHAYVGSHEAGPCHVVLMFATGFTYAADVTFVSMPNTTCDQSCAPQIEPTSGPFQVDNPPDTCVAVDGGDDAELDATSDAVGAADSGEAVDAGEER